MCAYERSFILHLGTGLLSSSAPTWHTQALTPHRQFKCTVYSQDTAATAAN